MARDSFLLRTDPQTMAALRKWADDELRSVNGQIEFVLRRALREAGRLSEVGVARPAPPADKQDTGAVTGAVTDAVTDAATGVVRGAVPGSVAEPATGQSPGAGDTDAGSDAASQSGGG